MRNDSATYVNCKRLQRTYISFVLSTNYSREGTVQLTSLVFKQQARELNWVVEPLYITFFLFLVVFHQSLRLSSKPNKIQPHQTKLKQLLTKNSVLYLSKYKVCITTAPTHR